MNNNIVKSPLYQVQNEIEEECTSESNSNSINIGNKMEILIYVFREDKKTDLNCSDNEDNYYRTKTETKKLADTKDREKSIEEKPTYTKTIFDQTTGKRKPIFSCEKIPKKKVVLSIHPIGQDKKFEGIDCKRNPIFLCIKIPKNVYKMKEVVLPIHSIKYDEQFKGIDCKGKPIFSSIKIQKNVYKKKKEVPPTHSIRYDERFKGIKRFMLRKKVSNVIIHFEKEKIEYKKERNIIKKAFRLFFTIDANKKRNKKRLKTTLLNITKQIIRDVDIRKNIGNIITKDTTIGKKVSEHDSLIPRKLNKEKKKIVQEIIENDIGENIEKYYCKNSLDILEKTYLEIFSEFKQDKPLTDKYRESIKSYVSEENLKNHDLIMEHFPDYLNASKISNNY